jgi:DNA mismatch repair protein PMS2
VRLPRLNAVFASRACRQAIMIGTALERQTMRRVVAQLAQLDAPWSCPHGRPTLRHLVDLAELRRKRGQPSPAGPA